LIDYSLVKVIYQTNTGHKFIMPPRFITNSNTRILRLHGRPVLLVRNFSNSSSSSDSKQIEPSSTSFPSTQGVLKAASSLLSNLHVKIASSLTSSLQPKDRERLLQSLNIKISNQDQNELEKHRKEHEEEGRIHNTIGQAVAAAVANEALKNKSLTDREREEIWNKAEQATLERVKHEILLKDRNKDSKEAAISSNDAQDNIQQEHHQQQQYHHHPILGPTLVDLGYKRIHLASAQTLSSIPIWEKQRIYRHDRAKAMAQDKLKSIELGLPGVISLHESIEGKLSILDGQHRVGMMTLLQEKKKDDAKINLILNQILVEVFPQSSTAATATAAVEDSHAQDLFTEINKAEPVKLLDMPGVAKVSDRRIINEASSILQDTYPEMFKPSQRCRSPHLNVDNLRDAIFAAGIINKHNLKNHKALVSWILQQNEELGKKYQEECPSSISVAALKKAKQYGFYLGLDSAWLYK